MSVRPSLKVIRGGEEGDIIARCKAGDSGAREELYHRTFPLCRSLVYSLLGNDPDGEDLLQEVYLEAFRSLHRFREDSSLATWMRAIVVHLVSKHLRRRRAGRRFREAWDSIWERRSTQDPAATLLARSALKRAHAVLSGLRVEDQVAFVLYHVEGLALAEVASITETPLSTVGDRVKRAQKQIVKALGSKELG